MVQIKSLTREELNNSLELVWRVFQDYEAVNYPESGNNSTKTGGMNVNKFIAYCGLDCEACEARLATINDDDALREKVAEDWGEMNRWNSKKNGSTVKAAVWTASGPCSVTPCAKSDSVQSQKVLKPVKTAQR